VKIASAKVDFMTIACATSSACSKERDAPCAKRSGLVINLWVKERSPRTRDQATPLHKGSLRLLRLVPLVKFSQTRTMTKNKNKIELPLMW
jgi:hypothetical protein